MSGRPSGPALLLTCEHAGRVVPAEWAARFAGAGPLLDSHRGWDPGALELARDLSRRLDAPLLVHEVTRLLADANRSEGHPTLFGPPVRGLDPASRERVLADWHRPHRAAVAAWIEAAVGAGLAVVHVAVHSFTPVLDGRPRTTGIGLLYDPARPGERTLCAAWSAALRRSAGTTVHRNRPYRGVADGLPTSLRRRFGAEVYVGVELEVRSDLLVGPDGRTEAVGEVVAEGLRHGLGALRVAGRVPPGTGSRDDAGP